MQAPPEKLGALYLGAEYDLTAQKRTDAPIVYDSRDLVTHAICIGMTGSGKTGLCVGLLEDAALDRVPAIIIDPKGDVTNLLLQFPELRTEDFLPWVNPGDAERKGQSVEEYAAATAEQWSTGLADWGIDGERIRSLLQTTGYTIYTPGSDAGIPVNILGSLKAPGLDWDTDSEAIGERINGTVAALLGLADVTVDPVRSREAVLLASIFEYYWRKGEDLDLAKLIGAIDKPPVRQVGVFDVDTYFPQKDRFDLAMAFNNIVAAPTFRNWLTGAPMDIERFLFSEDGKQPQHSIFYIAHLSDSERMFFVTLLLENVLTWVRRQSGTTSLRALLYFDEVFGYFPPTAEPPSKRPLLTLMKQGRAFGLGVVLVTQNPVDLDYKGLTNAGTWLIGKLQAERDKARVVEGLQGAIAEAGSSVKVDYGEVIGQLSSRVFLMHNVHEDAPVVFHTRWAQSYLRGPLTKVQIRELMTPQKEALAAAEPAATNLTSADTASPAATQVNQPPDAAAVPAGNVGNLQQTDIPDGYSRSAPKAGEGVQQLFVPLTVSAEDALAQVRRNVAADFSPIRAYLAYEPAALAASTVRYVDRKRDIDHEVERLRVAPLPTGPGRVAWENAEPLPITLGDLYTESQQDSAGSGPYFAAIPEAANSATELKRIKGDLADWLYSKARLTVNVNQTLGLTQKPGESDAAFRIRTEQAARERRDAEVEKLRQEFVKKDGALKQRQAKVEAALAKDRSESQIRKSEQWATIGQTVTGWLLGRKGTSGINTSMSKYRMASQAEMDVREGEAEVERITQERQAMVAEYEELAASIQARWQEALDDITTQEVEPRRSDVSVETLALGWLPQWVVEYSAQGQQQRSTVAGYTLPE